jgi:hypothetical protein
MSEELYFQNKEGKDLYWFGTCGGLGALITSEHLLPLSEDPVLLTKENFAEAKVFVMNKMLEKPLKIDHLIPNEEEDEEGTSPLCLLSYLHELEFLQSLAETVEGGLYLVDSY